MAILMSIKPEEVEKILNGEKTIIIAKTKPKCELTYKVYIYCTKGKQKLVEVLRKGEIKWFGKDENDRYKKNIFITMPYYNFGDKKFNMLGKVVAEFTLKRINTIEICDPDILINGKQCKQANLQAECQVSINDIMSYIGYGNDHDGWGRDWDKGYLWHIDNLKIYDKPKELGEFKHWVIDNYGWNNINKKENFYVFKQLQRPPQSWCYVEELGEE